MSDREKVINDLQDAVNDDWMWEHADYYAKAMENAIALLKEQEAVVRCEDCENWIPGYITDHDDFIPPKYGKYQQMVGHSAADYCSLAARKESR